MMDPNAAADALSAAVENFFTATYADQIEALVAVRTQMGPDQRARLVSALHRLGEQATNVLAALHRDGAW
jgi:hypothetical protein